MKLNTLTLDEQDFFNIIKCEDFFINKREKLFKFYKSYNPQVLLINLSSNNFFELIVYDLIKFIFCLKKDDISLQSCLTCSNCVRFKKGLEHPDLNYIFTDDNNIKIDDLEYMKKNINHRPTFEKKIIFIEEIEKMNIYTSNSILKIIEEPQKDNFFIFTTYNKSHLLDTILSRCQIYNLSYKESEIIESISLGSFLKSEINLKFNSLWKFSRGRILILFRIAKKDYKIFQERYNLVLVLEKKICIISFVENIISVKYTNNDIKDLVYLLILFLYDIQKILILDKKTIQESFIINYDFYKSLQNIAKNFSTLKVSKLLKKAKKVYNFFNYQNNFNKQLLLEDLLIDIIKI